MSDAERNLLALHLVEGIGPRLCAALLERFGSAGAALRASAAELLEVPYLGPKVAESLRQVLANRDVDAELGLMEKHGVGVLMHGTPAYPAMLAAVAVPPTLLYCKGALEPRDGKAIAIVGSRACTSYGKRVAERMAMDFVRAGYTVVSGLARGIDGAAHQGALNAKGRTLAVLAGGLSKIYPPEHADLAAKVAANGALLTESAMRMEPMPGMFPARNRIISGLSRAVVVVEAAEKSGALYTAHHAAEQGREVFAVPGPVDSVASGGCLKLIRDGAKLVRHAGDVLEDLDCLPPLLDEAPLFPAEPPPDLDTVNRRLWEHLAERRTVDELTQHLGLPAHDVMGRLMLLELKKVVRRQPGNWYERA